jgi:hypothetical protein
METIIGWQRMPNFPTRSGRRRRISLLTTHEPVSFAVEADHDGVFSFASAGLGQFPGRIDPNGSSRFGQGG